MLLRLRKIGIKRTDWVIDVYEDQGSHSCGESRSDWTRVGTINIDRLIRALYKMLQGKSEREYV